MYACNACLIVSAYGDDDNLYPDSVAALGTTQVTQVNDEEQFGTCGVCCETTGVKAAEYLN